MRGDGPSVPSFVVYVPSWPVVVQVSRPWPFPERRSVPVAGAGRFVLVFDVAQPLPLCVVLPWLVGRWTVVVVVVVVGIDPVPQKMRSLQI